jgi:hypothetical protein
MADRADDKGLGLVDRRPRVPAKRFDDDFAAPGWKRGVPEGLTYKTKNLAASVAIDEIFAAGLFDRE